MTVLARLGLGSLLVGVGFLAAAHGCSSPGGGGSDAIADAAPGDAGKLFDVDYTDAPACTIPPKPVGVPDDWELYTDYDPCCLLYVPKTPASLPPPLKWRSCDNAWLADGGIDGSVSGADAAGCRQIDQPTAGSPMFGASVQDDKVTLATGEFLNGFYVNVVAEADGPVHQALLETDRGSGCTPTPRDMRDGKYVYAMYPPRDFRGGGFVGGDVREFRPSFRHHFGDLLIHDMVTGTVGVLDVDEHDQFNLFEWSATPLVVRNPQDIGLQNSFPSFAGKALFWESSAGPVNRIAVYTEDGGAKDLLTFGSDTAHGATDLGADGVTMVWMQGTGHTKDPMQIGFDSAELMTSPFATEPTKVVARRLRSELPKAMGVAPFKVGCGYAARTNGLYLRILRLSDGVSWVLPQGGDTWFWVNPLAITCEEVFVTVSTGLNGNNIARVRFDALGPGIPPD